MAMIKQFRYKRNDEEFSNVSIEDLIGKNSNEGLLTRYPNVTQLGIQGVPGTVFWINNSDESANGNAATGIQLNWTGIFELDLTNLNATITHLHFDDISKYYTDEDSLIIDILYDNSFTGGVN